MPTSNTQMIYKLQFALNSRGMKILCNRSQFYSDKQNRPVTMYKVAQSIWVPETQRYTHKTIFSSTSQIQVVLFMRNLWYLINDKEIPPTNRMKGAAEFERKWNEFLETYEPPESGGFLIQVILFRMLKYPIEFCIIIV